MISTQSLKSITHPPTPSSQVLKNQLHQYKRKVAEIQELLSHKQLQHSPWLPDQSTDLEPGNQVEYRGFAIKQSLFKGRPRQHTQAVTKVKPKKSIDPPAVSESGVGFERSRVRQKLKYPETGAITSRNGRNSVKRERASKAQKRKVEYQAYTKHKDNQGLTKVKSVPHFNWVTIRDQHTNVNGKIQTKDKAEILRSQVQHSSISKTNEKFSRNGSPQIAKFRRLPTSPSLIQHTDFPGLTTQETVQKLQDMLFPYEDFNFTEAVSLSKTPTEEVQRPVNFPRSYRRKVPSPVKDYIEEGRNDSRTRDRTINNSKEITWSFSQNKDMSSSQVLGESKEAPQSVRRMITSIKDRGSKSRERKEEQLELKGVLKISEILKRQNRTNCPLRNRSTSEAKHKSRSSSLRAMHDLKLIEKVKNW